MHEVLDRHGVDYELAWTLSGAPFLTPRGGLVDALTAAVAAVTGVTPALSTSGGTSDGRFLATISREVVEFGPLNASIHRIDERSPWPTSARCRPSTSARSSHCWAPERFHLLVGRAFRPASFVVTRKGLVLPAL